MGNRTEQANAKVLLDGKEFSFELTQLTNQSKDLRKELNELAKANDKAGWDKKAAELVKVKKEMQAYKDVTAQTTSVLKNLNGASLDALQKEQKKITAELKNMERGTAEYINKSKSLQLVEAELGKVKAEMHGVATQSKGMFSGMADGFNKYFAMTTAFVASITGIIFGFRKAVDEFNKFEERVDNLSSLTGLAGQELNWLSQQAKEMSVATVEGGIRIKQSATDIVDAFTKVGSARSELLENKEALKEVTQEAIILSMAAKTQLQPAVDGLTMMLNQFNAPAEDSRRIINAMAAGSKVGAGEIPYLTEAIEKSGTVASDVGMSYEELIATIETLAPRIKAPEIAGRTLKGVILDLQKTSNDTNPTIVGFSTAIENLGKKHLSTIELLKIFGTENITTAKILLNNQEQTNKYTKAITGTNTAIEQATINTDNNAAKLAQAQNRVQLMSIELGEKLAPALTFSTNAFTYLLKAIISAINIYKEHKTAINNTLLAIAAYTTVVYGLAAAKKVYSIAVDIATAATKAFNAVSTKSPWGLIAAIVTVAASAIYDYWKNMNKVSESTKILNDVQQNYNQNLAQEKGKLDSLFGQLLATNKGSEERKKLIDEINGTYNTTLQNLANESEFVKQVNSAYETLLVSLQKKALMSAREQGLTDIYKKEADAQTEYLKAKEARDNEAFLAWDNMQNRYVWRKRADSQSDANQIMDLVGKEVEANEIYTKTLNDLADAKKKLLTFSKEDLALVQSGDGKKTGTPINPPASDDDKKKAQEYADAQKDLIKQKEYEIKLKREENYLTEEGIAKRNAEVKGLQDELQILQTLGLGDVNTMGQEIDFVTAKKIEFIKLTARTEEEATAEILQVELDANKSKLSMMQMMAMKKKILNDHDREMMTELAKNVIDLEQKKQEAQLNLKAKEEYNKNLLDAQKKYDTLSADELAAAELSNLEKLKQTYGDKLFTTETYEAAKAEIENRYRDLKAQKDQQAIEKMLKKYKEGFAKQQAITETFSNLFAAAKNLEMQLVDDVNQRKGESDEKYKERMAKAEEEKKKIQKKYAIFELITAGSSIVASTAMAIMKLVAAFPVTLGQPWATLAGIAGGLELAGVVAEKAKIMSMAKGQYPVTDQHGNNYNAEYGGQATTGFVNKPTMFLAGEAGQETILSAPHTRNIQMNFPWLMNAIMATRTMAYASGSYPAGATNNTTQQIVMDPVLASVVNDLSNILKQGIRALVTPTEVTDIRKIIKTHEQIEREVS